MSKWGSRLQVSDGELKEMVDVCSRDLRRRIRRGDYAPDLANLVRKGAQALARKKQKRLVVEEGARQ